jgi:hypothetical protein
MKSTHRRKRRIKLLDRGKRSSTLGAERGGRADPSLFVSNRYPRSHRRPEGRWAINYQKRATLMAVHVGSSSARNYIDQKQPTRERNATK